MSIVPKFWPAQRLAAMARSSLAAVAALSVSCNGTTDATNNVTPGVTSLSLGVMGAPEFDGTQVLVVIGDTVIAHVDALAPSSSCPPDWGCRADVDIDLWSSDPNVLTPGHQQIHAQDGIAYVPFAARGVGSVQITASAQGYTRSTQMTVTAAPLPIDSLNVTWSEVLGPLVEIHHDDHWRIQAATVGPLGSVRLAFVTYRSGHQVFLYREHDFAIASSDPNVVWASLACPAPAVDPACNNTGYWITGVTPGNATVTVTARDIHYSFPVKVVQK
jgi:hypothetical protein